MRSRRPERPPQSRMAARREAVVRPGGGVDVVGGGATEKALEPQNRAARDRRALDPRAVDRAVRAPAVPVALEVAAGRVSGLVGPVAPVVAAGRVSGLVGAVATVAAAGAGRGAAGG